jgi:hypothetical protein
MGRKFFSSAALAFLLAAGCGGSGAIQPAAPPPRITPPSTEIETERPPTETPPELIAPPPAYGNRVVLARAEFDRRGR